MAKYQIVNKLKNLRSYSVITWLFVPSDLSLLFPYFLKSLVLI